MALCIHEAADPCAGVHLPAWTLVQSLHGASQLDPNSLDAGSSGLNTADGLWTMDRNTTRGAFGGVGDGITYALPLSGLHPTWDTMRETLAVRVDFTTQFADDGNGVAIALCNQGVVDLALEGKGFAQVNDTSGNRHAIQQTAGLSSNVNLVFTSLYMEFKLTAEPRCQALSLAKAGSGWTPANTWHNFDHDDSSDMYLWVQGINASTGTGTAESSTFKVYTKRILRGDYFP